MTEQPQNPSEDLPSPDEPIGQPADISSPTEGEHLSSPEPGYPAGETEPHGGLGENPHEHPEDIGDTTPEQDTTP